MAIAASLVGCSVESQRDTASGTTAPGALPASGSFGGSYEVPVPVELSAAARFDVTEIEWVVTGSTVHLSYNLPRALVGKALRVDFVGTLDPSASHAALSGAAGTSDCVVSATQIVCTETMPGLIPVAPDLTVVASLAAASYTGVAQDRIAVATRFAGDPIGIARIDLGRPGAPEPVEVEPPHN